MLSPEEILTKYNLSKTKIRLELVKIFSENHKPLSIFDFRKHQIFKEMNESTFYRNVTILLEAGILQSVPNPDGYNSYEFSLHSHHHHHIVCNSCKVTKCLTGCGLEDKLVKMAKKVGFSLKGHSLELFGICSTCLSD